MTEQDLPTASHSSRRWPLDSARAAAHQSLMPFVVLVPLVISLVFYFLPVCLLAGKPRLRAQDFFVSSEPAPSGVIRNSSIAYALPIATFITFSGLGANGVLGPMIVSSICLGAGVYVFYLMRRPILRFLDCSLRGDRSITVHQFIARQHGNDARVRLFASGVTMLALAGLAVAAPYEFATLLKPILPAGATYVFVCVMTILAIVYTIVSGNSGVMRLVQLQLGVIYLGLFGSAVLLIYMMMSQLNPMPPHGPIALAYVAGFCCFIPFYRRVRFVDTSPIGKGFAGDRGDETLSARLFVRLEKILNVSVTVSAGFVAAFAGMELYSVGFGDLAGHGVSAWSNPAGMSGVELTALFLLPLCYPIVDITNWQRIAAFAQDAGYGPVEPTVRAAALRAIIRGYAVESPLLWLFMGTFGTVAVVAAAVPGNAPSRTIIAGLASQQNEVAMAALSLLTVGLGAMVLATMSSVFSAGLCVIRYDVLPTVRADLQVGAAPAVSEAGAIRRAVITASAFYLGVSLVLCVADAYLPVVFGARQFLAVLFAFFCAQLSFVPLVLGPMIGRSGGGGTVSAGWALAILGCGAAVGLGTAAISVVSGNEPLLWTAVPACLGSGVVLFAIARTRSK
jgi:hypothetical protein